MPAAPLPQDAPRRATRSLAVLAASASTSRVLNLGYVAKACRDSPAWSERPMFRHPGLNSCLILKHRLRVNERVLFDGEPKAVATKLLFPYDWSDLTIGGRSILFGQRGFDASLRYEIGEGIGPVDRDMLAILDGLPSLDPFLLREHLRRHGRRVADCYFEISPADADSMRRHVAEQLRELISLAFGAGSADSLLGKMVDAMLSAETDQRLEPLQRTLGLTGDEFKDGMFSWKGFLYYKWKFGSIERDVESLLVDFVRLRISRGRSPELKAFVEQVRRTLVSDVEEERTKVRATLQVYDDAYRALVGRGDAQAFRDFLRRAPSMFVELGDRLGIVGHMSSFWRYRFPNGAHAEIELEEAADLFREFDAGLARSRRTEMAWD